MVISLFYINFVSGLRINEVMFHPEENDNYNEWVEIYNDENEDLDLTGLNLCGKEILEGYVDRQGEMNNEDGMTLDEGNYAIITDGGSGTEVYDNYDIPQSTLSLHVDASSLCGGLSNSGDTLVLEESNGDTDEVTYEEDVEVGSSLEYINGEFLEGPLGGTPGEENSEQSDDSDEGDDNNEEGGNEDENEPGEDEDNESNDSDEEDNDENEEDEQENNNFQQLTNQANRPPETRQTNSFSEVKNKKIVLKSNSEKDKEDDEKSTLSSQEILRRGVLYSFLILMLALIALLSWKKL